MVIKPSDHKSDPVRDEGVSAVIALTPGALKILRALQYHRQKLHRCDTFSILYRFIWTGASSGAVSRRVLKKYMTSRIYRMKLSLTLRKDRYGIYYKRLVCRYLVARLLNIIDRSRIESSLLTENLVNILAKT